MRRTIPAIVIAAVYLNPSDNDLVFSVAIGENYNGKLSSFRLGWQALLAKANRKCARTILFGSARISARSEQIGRVRSATRRSGRAQRAPNDMPHFSARFARPINWLEPTSLRVTLPARQEPRHSGLRLSRRVLPEREI
jgi:hypothetical protein